MCLIPTITAWIFFSDSLIFTVSHLPATIWRKSFVLMERREEHKQVRVQTAWLLMTPTVPDWLFSGNVSVLCWDVREGSKVRKWLCLKKNKRINCTLS